MANTTSKPGPATSDAADRAGDAASRLAQEIVIENAGGDAAVGAQAIAPDHTPRAVAAPAGIAPVARPAAIPATDALREIEQFLYRQSELLDSKLWQEYIDLFADDGVYWMPVTPEQTEWEG